MFKLEKRFELKGNYWESIVEDFWPSLSTISITGELKPRGGFCTGWVGGKMLSRGNPRGCDSHEPKVEIINAPAAKCDQVVKVPKELCLRCPVLESIMCLWIRVRTE